MGVAAGTFGHVLVAIRRQQTEAAPGEDSEALTNQVPGLLPSTDQYRAPAVHVTATSPASPWPTSAPQEQRTQSGAVSSHPLSGAEQEAQSFVSELDSCKDPVYARIPGGETKTSRRFQRLLTRPPQARHLEKEPQQADDSRPGPPTTTRHVHGRHLQRVAARLAVRRWPAYSNLPGAPASFSVCLVGAPLIVFQACIPCRRRKVRTRDL